MKKFFLYVFLVFLSSTFFAQKLINTEDSHNNEKVAFYVRIPNFNNLPTILSKSSKSGVNLKHENSKVQTVFNKYKIYDFVQAFPTSKRLHLRQIYLMKVNNIELMHELRNNFSDIYTFAEYIGKEPEPLTLEYSESATIFYTPNDYGLQIPQTDLDLINAKEAWNYTTGSSNIKIGIVDTKFNVNHPELLGSINSVTIYNDNRFHGTAVAMNMAGNTNNGIGLASIGSNCFIEAKAGLGLNSCLLLSQEGVKVINSSWLNSCSFIQTHQDIIDEIHDNGTVLVFAAGNNGTSSCNGPSNVVYPAAYNHVIAVTSIHHRDFMQPTYDEFGNYTGEVLRKKDTHDNSWVFQQKKDGSHNHTHVVDIAAPGYDVPTIGYNSVGYGTSNGTSHAAPIVAGTIGLMKTVNSNLTTEEVESVLKLTSTNIYNIPENANYIDKLGAGRLDAGKAVRMAYKMAQPFDTIKIENRDFYRNWKFEINNAPYGIMIKNEKFRDSIKVDFKGRDFIELENTTLSPNASGSIFLSINQGNALRNFNNTKQISNYNNNNNTFDFFEGKTFQLEYFLKNGVKELFSANYNQSPKPPYIVFLKNDNSSQLYAKIDGFCNLTDTKYKIENGFLEVLERGSTTLEKCKMNEEIEFFKPLTGNIYMQKPAKKVNFEITKDKQGLWIWTDENHKLFFTNNKKLKIENRLLDSVISIYPNPSKKIINIDLKLNSVEITEISIIDSQGRQLSKNKTNFKTINISNLSEGVYFLKLKSKNNNLIIKKFIKK